MNGNFTVKNPEANYAYTESVLDSERIALSTVSPVMKIDERYDRDFLVNLSETTEIPVIGKKTGASFKITDCFGKTITKRKFKKDDICLEVPFGGILHIYR